MTAKILFLALLVTSFGTLHADPPAVEQGNPSDVPFRGQGPNPFCHAFAEEQLIKDALCSGTQCENNASLYQYSILEIVDVNAHKALKRSQDPAAALHQTRFWGMNDFFTLGDTLNPTIARSECTLEKDLFKWNRMREFNPAKQNLQGQLYDYLSFYRSFGPVASRLQWVADKRKEINDNPYWDADARRDALKFLDESEKAFAEYITQARIAGFVPLLTELDKLAAEELREEGEKNTNWMDRVFAYRKCDARADLRHLKPKFLMTADMKTIQTTIKNLVTKNKSVMLGLCSEVLETEKLGDPNKCGGHSLVAKRRRQVGNRIELLIVDSAFFSPRPRNADGSMWIPESVVYTAVQKYGARVLKTLAELRKHFDSAVASSIADVEKAYAEGTKQYKNELKQRGDLTEAVRDFLSSSGHPYTQLVEKYKTKQMRTEAAVDELMADMKRVALEDIREQLEAQRSQVGKSVHEERQNNLAWFE